MHNLLRGLKVTRFYKGEAAEHAERSFTLQ